MTALCWMTVTLPMKSAVTADYVTNYFALQWEGSSPVNPTHDEFNLAAVNLRDFYSGIKTYLSGDIDTTALRFRGFRRADPAPRVALYDESFGFTEGPTGFDLPHEIACVVSLVGVPVSGVRPARNRGRFYLGPLTSSSIDTSGTGEGAGQTGFFTSAFTSAIASAADTLADAMVTDQWELGAWSGTDGAFRSLSKIFVDNAIDIQRRRGERSSFRTSIAR